MRFIICKFLVLLFVFFGEVVGRDLVFIVVVVVFFFRYFEYKSFFVFGFEYLFFVVIGGVGYVENCFCRNEE